MRRLTFGYLVIMIFGLMGLGSISHAAETVGSFKIDLVGFHKVQWEKYQKDFSATRFAVRLNSSGGFDRSIWYSCKTVNCNDRGRSGFLYDLKINYGGEWLIVAETKKVIWKGPVCYNGQNLSKYHICKTEM